VRARAASQRDLYFRHKIWYRGYVTVTVLSSVAVPDPGSGAFLTPGSGMGKKARSGSGMNNLGHISESLKKQFSVLKYISSLMQIRDGKKFGSGIGDGKISDPGSGINIPGSGFVYRKRIRIWTRVVNLNLKKVNKNIIKIGL
jgi:hypothetical protein